MPSSAGRLAGPSTWSRAAAPIRCIGDIYGYLRNQRLNAANPLSNSKLPVTQAQYGASLGGPIVRERTFYFANFEQRMLNQSGLVTISLRQRG